MVLTSESFSKRRLTEGWDRRTRGFLTDLEPTVIKNSDIDGPVELIICVDTGQHQRSLPSSCPGPPPGGTRARFMASLKRSPSPTEDSAPEQQPRKRRPHSVSENPADDEAESAEGSNSVDSTLTTTDHPATVEKMEIGPLKPLRVPSENWTMSGFFDYCSGTDSVKYPDLSNRKLYIPLILQRIINTVFTTQTDYDFNKSITNLVSQSISYIRKIYIRKHEEMTLLLSEEHKNKVRKKSQFAFSFFRRKDGTFTKPFGPYFPKDGGKVHSEDLVCTEIIDLGDQLTEYSELYIYTLNSPCMGRKNTEPCMIRLISLSDRLDRRYGIKTYVTFSKYYGSTGPVCKCLPDHTYRKCSYGADSPPFNNIRELLNPVNNDEDPQSPVLIKLSSRYKTDDQLLTLTPNTPRSPLIRTNSEDCHKTGQDSLHQPIKNTDYHQNLTPTMVTVTKEEELESKFLMKNSSRYKTDDQLLTLTPNKPRSLVIRTNSEDSHKTGQDSLHHPIKNREEDLEYKFLMKNSSRYKTNDQLLALTPNKPRSLVIRTNSEDTHKTGQDSLHQPIKNTDYHQNLTPTMVTVAKEEELESKFLMKNSSRYKTDDPLLTLNPNKPRSPLIIRTNSEDCLKTFPDQDSLQHPIKHTDYNQEFTPTMVTITKEDNLKSKFLIKHSSRYKTDDQLLTLTPNKPRSPVIRTNSEDDLKTFPDQDSLYQPIKSTDYHQNLTPTMITVTKEEELESKFLKKNSSRYKTDDQLLVLTPNEAAIKRKNLYNSKFQDTSDQHPSKRELSLARNIILRESDLQSRFLMKTSSKFKKNELINYIKENIPKDKRHSFLEIINKFHPKISQDPQYTFEEYEEKAIDTSGEFEKTLRDVITEDVDESVCNSICEIFQSEFLKWWAENLERSYGTFLNQRLSEGINRAATDLFIHSVQKLPYPPTIGCIGDITDPDMNCSDAVLPYST